MTAKWWMRLGVGSRSIVIAGGTREPIASLPLVGQTFCELSDLTDDGWSLHGGGWLVWLGSYCLVFMLNPAFERAA